MTRASSPGQAAGAGRSHPRTPRVAAHLGWLRRRWRDHPRAALALRAAVAAAIAWAVAGVLPGPAADFPYYAPFGAVIATTFTLAGSVRESVQSVGAIAVGGSIAWVIDLVVPIGNGPLAIALVVIPCVLAAGWRPLGAMGGWVPTAGLFTLIVGHGEASYVGAYAGLTLLGAVIGIAVNAAFPPLPLAPAQRAIGLVRDTLGSELRSLADLAEGDEELDREEWDAAHRTLMTDRAHLQAALTEVRQASRKNLRARRYAQSIDSLEKEAATLDRLVLTVSDLADLLVVGDGLTGAQSVLSRPLRSQIATVLRRLSDSLAEPPADSEDDADSGPSADVAEAVREARRTVPQDDQEMLANGVLLELRRAANALAQVRD